MKGNKTVVITGASRGIGKAIALKFASQNYNICINCKTNKNLLEKLRLELLDMGVDCISFVGDMSDYNNAKEMYELIHKHFTGIDVLVNNAVLLI